MKIVSLILSIYLVALSCFPCQDMEQESMVCKTIQVVTSQYPELSNKDAKKDLCSPFCSCSCCGFQIAFFIESTTFNFLITKNQIKTIVSNYLAILISSFLGNIWQPPQLV